MMKAKKDSIVRIMLKDEYQRVILSIEDYKNEIKKLPQGNLYNIKRKNKLYKYLSYYENGMYKLKYINDLNSNYYKQLYNNIRLRKHYEDILYRLQFEKQEIELYLKVGEDLYEE